MKKESEKVKIVTTTKVIADKDAAARRLIRDFLSNRLSYSTEVPTDTMDTSE